MTRVRSNTVTETGVAFFSAGGHSHDGINSSIIDTSKYSIFDFNFGLTSTNSARINSQTKNERAFRDFIMKVVNQSVLQPAGVVLQDNIINARNIIAGSITSDEIAANTITATNIQAGTITASEIAAGSITSELLQANIIIGNNALFTGTVTASTIVGSTITSDTSITGSTITGAIISGGSITGGDILGGNITGGVISSSGTAFDRIVIVPGDFSPTTQGNTLRFLSRAGDDFDRSPSIRAEEGDLRISGGGSYVAPTKNSALVFNSFPGGIRLLGDDTYMQQRSEVGVNLKDGKGVFRNISFGTTKPDSPNRKIGDIHFS